MADLDLVMPDLGWDVVEAPPLEVAREIEASGTWMVFWHVEEMPEYDALLHEVLDGVMSRVSGREGDLGPLEAASSSLLPGTVTPAHIDPGAQLPPPDSRPQEIRGWCVPGHGDPTAGPPSGTYHDGSHRNLDWLPAGGSVAETRTGHGCLLAVPLHVLGEQRVTKSRSRSPKPSRPPLAKVGPGPPVQWPPPAFRSLPRPSRTCVGDRRRQAAGRGRASKSGGAVR